jgi:hypothetical protein
LTAVHEALFDEQKRMEERPRKAHEELLRTTAVRTKVEELTKEYFALLSSKEPQQRGYRLEKIIRQLFELFDLDPRTSFKMVGEQIDGAFTTPSVSSIPDNVAPCIGVPAERTLANCKGQRTTG